MMASKIQSVKGMNDLLPDTIESWHRIENALKKVASAYGYQEIRTPIAESTELFIQSIGDATDIVEKEMYTFVDSGDNRLTLRPEATASTVRACNQHGLLHNTQRRLWYMGPMFRREKPQRGRYRQFHQFGIEAFGWKGPDIDTEVIRVGARIWKELGVKNISLEVNTLGSEQSRGAYRQALVEFLNDNQSMLDDDSLRRLKTNPLRVLDSKVPSTQAILANAPTIQAFLNTEEKEHFDQLVSSLSEFGLDPKVNPKLVRGLDYYTSTVFEWVTDQLGSQSAVCAGGRYDKLVEERGGKPTPAIGFAMGIERLVELIEIEGNEKNQFTPDVYVVCTNEAFHQTSVTISERLRDQGLKVISHCGGGKVKNQMKRADQSRAVIAVSITDADSNPGQINITAKRLRDHSESIELNQESVVEWCVANQY